ncbi:hypothetical protein SDC9_94987 [bioreactor metagenome]|uniref:Uncharacterized protein n=1 Tax=bioreactor metagenome TaxID=1076179 RepID=A0A645ABM9_9ZZZZ
MHGGAQPDDPMPGQRGPQLGVGDRSPTQGEHPAGRQGRQGGLQFQAPERRLAEFGEDLGDRPVLLAFDDGVHITEAHAEPAGQQRTHGGLADRRWPDQHHRG